MPKVLYPTTTGGVGPAPADAPYLTDGAVAGLTNERNIQALTAELVWNRSAPIGDVNEGINLFAAATTATGAFSPYAIAADILVEPAAASLAGPIGLKGTWRTTPGLAFDVLGAVGDQPSAAVTGFSTADFNPANGIDTLFGVVGQTEIVDGTHPNTLGGMVGRALMLAGSVPSLVGTLGALRATGGTISLAIATGGLMDCPAPGPTVTGLAAALLAVGSFFGTTPLLAGVAAIDIATTPGNVADQRGVWVQNQTGGVVNWNLYVDTGGQSTLGSFASVGANVGPFAAEQFRVVGDAYISGKLTVVGVIDPTAVLLSDPAAGTQLYFDSADGQTAPVSAVGHGRIRYNDAVGFKLWEISENGGAYHSFFFGSGWIDNGAVVNLITPADHVVVGALADDVAGRRLIVTSKGADTGIRVTPLVGTDVSFDVATAADAFARLTLADSSVVLGSGAIAPDVRLQRTGATVLTIDNNGVGGAFIVPRTDGTGSFGTNLLRWLDSIANQFRVFAAAGNLNPTAVLDTARLRLGLNSADALSWQLQVATATSRADMGANDELGANGTGSFTVRSALADVNPTVQISDASIAMGINSADALSVKFGVQFTNRLDFGNGDSVGITGTGTAFFESRNLTVDVNPRLQLGNTATGGVIRAGAGGGALLDLKIERTAASTFSFDNNAGGTATFQPSVDGIDNLGDDGSVVATRRWALTATNRLSINGRMRWQRRLDLGVSGAIGVDDLYTRLLVGGITGTLPLAATALIGAVYVVKRTSTGALAGSVAVVGGSGNTIDSTGAFLLTLPLPPGGAAFFVSNGGVGAAGIWEQL